MTKNKALKLALIWLLLALAVFAYTDRDEYTWRYHQGDLHLIRETREQAKQNQTVFDAAYALEAAQAAQRQAEGQWGGHEQYAGARETLPARDDASGLNLMWGTYEVMLEYTSGEPLDLSVVSAGRQAFIEEG